MSYDRNLRVRTQAASAKFAESVSETVEAMRKLADRPPSAPGCPICGVGALVVDFETDRGKCQNCGVVVDMEVLQAEEAQHLLARMASTEGKPSVPDLPVDTELVGRQLAGRLQELLEAWDVDLWNQSRLQAETRLASWATVDEASQMPAPTLQVFGGPKTGKSWMQQAYERSATQDHSSVGLFQQMPTSHDLQGWGQSWTATVGKQIEEYVDSTERRRPHSDPNLGSKVMEALGGPNAAGPVNGTPVYVVAQNRGHARAAIETWQRSGQAATYVSNPHHFSGMSGPAHIVLTGSVRNLREWDRMAEQIKSLRVMSKTVTLEIWTDPDIGQT